MPVSNQAAFNVQGGYILSPDKGFWSIIESEGTVNLLQNPSFEVALNDYLNAFNGSVNRVANSAATRGQYSLEMTPTATGSYVEFGINNNLSGLPNTSPAIIAPSTTYAWSADLNNDLDAAQFNLSAYHYYHYDNFNRADNAATLGNVQIGADTRLWVISGGATFGTLNTFAYCPSDGDKQTATVLSSYDATVIADAIVEADVFSTALNSGSNYRVPALLIKSTGAGDLILELSNGAFRLKKLVAGVLTQLNSVAATSTNSTWYRLKSIQVGNVIQGYLNDVLMFTYTLTGGDVAPGLSLKHGLILFKGGLPIGSNAYWDNFKVSPLDSLKASLDFTPTARLSRQGIVFNTPAYINVNGVGLGGMVLRATKKTGSLNKYNLDAYQLEAKDHITTYIDGNEPNGIWSNDSHSSSSIRATGEFGGRIYNLKDKGLQITAFLGAGLPNLKNISIPYAQLGGEFYQRTNAQSTLVTLVGILEKEDFLQFQKTKSDLENIVTPNNLSKQGKPLILRFQSVDSCGNPNGKEIDMPCYYVGGLNGNVQNLYQENLTLQFVEYLPPSKREPYQVNATLGFSNTLGITNGSAFKRNLAGWFYLNGALPTTNALTQDSAGRVYFGTETSGGTALVYGDDPNDTTGVYFITSPAFNGAINAIASRKAGTVYVGGAFTTIGGVAKKYIAVSTDNMATFTQLGSTASFTIEAQVLAICVDNNGRVYAGGTFGTFPNHISYIDPGSTSWNLTMGGGGTPGVNSTVRAIVQGLDQKIYIGGDFTTAAGATVNYVTAYDSSANTFAALNAGFNALVRVLVVGPDGRIYAGGDFTTANGVTCNHIAVWNGVAWTQVGGGLNGNVYSLSWDVVNNELYAGGTFTGPANNSLVFSEKAARYTNGIWIGLDTDLGGAPTVFAILATRPITVDLIPVIYIGSAQNSTTTLTSAKTTVTNNGTAGVYPIIQITGPGKLNQISNLSTKTDLFFNYTLQTGETAYLFTDPLNRSFISNLQGNVTSKLLPGSDLAGFGFRPGANIIQAFINGTTSGATSITAFWQNTYYSFASGVQA